MQTEQRDYLLAEIARLQAHNKQLRAQRDKLRRSRDQWRARARRHHAATLAMPEDDPRHGTDNGYNNLGCRCERCRKAHNQAHKEWTWRTGRRRPHEEYAAERRAEAEARDNHGTETRYVSLGCRCDACTVASRDARRARRARMSEAEREAVRASDRARKPELRLPV